MLNKRRLLDIVIVNWNSGSYLASCLDSISGAQMDRGFISSITIVDNASTDASKSVTVVPDLNLNTICNAQNLGFGRACNQGAAEGIAPYLLFLNPDTQVNAGYLATPLEFLESPENSAIAVAGIQMIDESAQISRTCAYLPTVAQMLLRSLGLDQIPGLRSYGYMMRSWDHMQTRQVDHVMGAFYLIRREVFESLKGFDEDYFVYLEDLDLSSRIKKSGQKCIYLTGPSIVHAQGGSSRKIQAQRLYYSLHARLIYAKKHYSLPGRWLVTLSTLILEPLIRLGRATVMGHKSEFSNTLNAYRTLYRRLIQGHN